MPPPGPQTSQAEADRLLGVLAPLGNFALLSRSDDNYRFTLKQEGRDVGDLVVALPRPGSDKPRVRSAHYAIKIWNPTVNIESVTTLVKAADVIVAADGGAVPEAPVEMIELPKRELFATACLMAIMAIALALLRRGKVTLDIRKPHVIQACVHSSIFIYWSLYWPGVRYQAPIILLMILLAYASDAAFAFGRFGSWRLGLSPLPVVFSTNLFVWLDWKGAVLAMVGAFATKSLIQRDGHHIFNPSVAGLTLNAIATILFPNVIHFGGLFHTLNIAPNMAEWIFLGSLIPLTIFRLLPVSVGSIIGLYYITGAPGAVRPTLLLMMTLLATDPATTPRSNLGRFIFGLIVGSTYMVFRILLQHLGQPDDFAKILSVPFPNLIVPQLDALAMRITAFVQEKWPVFWKRLVPIPNRAWVAAWILLFGYAIHQEKPLDYEPTLHWTWGTPLVVRAQDGVPRCEINPVFCRPFSFVSEAQSWATAAPPPTVAHTNGP